MPHLLDEPKAEEVGEDLGDVVDDGGNSEQGRGAAVVLSIESGRTVRTETTQLKFVTCTFSMHVTCRCQKRNVKMSPMPKPMNQATNKNEAHLRFLKCESTVTHSGISLFVWANIFVCEKSSRHSLRFDRNRFSGDARELARGVARSEH